MGLDLVGTKWKTHELDWRVVEDEDGLVIADIRVFGHDGGWEVANLIAAAPELLKAAKFALELLEGFQLKTDTEGLLKNAISKAEGR